MTYLDLQTVLDFKIGTFSILLSCLGFLNALLAQYLPVFTATLFISSRNIDPKGGSTSQLVLDFYLFFLAYRS